MLSYKYRETHKIRSGYSEMALLWWCLISGRCKEGKVHPKNTNLPPTTGNGRPEHLRLVPLEYNHAHACTPSVYPTQSKERDHKLSYEGLDTATGQYSTDGQLNVHADRAHLLKQLISHSAMQDGRVWTHPVAISVCFHGLVFEQLAFLCQTCQDRAQPSRTHTHTDALTLAKVTIPFITDMQTLFSVISFSVRL